MVKKNRRKIIFVKAAVSAAFFFILFSFVQRNELVSVFSGVNWFFFISSFLLAIVMLMVSCMKWKVLLDASGQRLNYFTLMRIYLIGYFFSNLLPSTVGGDVIRSYYVGRLIDNQASAATSVFLERFTGMLFLLVLVIVAPLMQPELYRNPFVYIPVIGATFLLLLVCWIWKVKESLLLLDMIMQRVFVTLNRWSLWSRIKWIQQLLFWTEKIYIEVLKRLRKFKTELQASLAAIRNDRWTILFLVILTVVFYLLTWVNVYICFLAFGVHPGFISTSSLVPTIMFVGQLPLTLLGNMGYIESVFVFYFLQIQIPVAASLAMGLLLRVKMLWLGIIGYLVYLSLTRGKSSSFKHVGNLRENS